MRQDRDLLRLRTDEDFMDHLVKVFAKEKADDKQAAGAKVISEYFQKCKGSKFRDLRKKNILKYQPCHFPVMAICFVVLIYLNVFQ